MSAVSLTSSGGSTLGLPSRSPRSSPRCMHNWEWTPHFNLSQVVGKAKHRVFVSTASLQYRFLMGDGLLIDNLNVQIILKVSRPQIVS